jgi:hypothetical protein
VHHSKIGCAMSQLGHFRLSCPPAASPILSAAPPIAAVLSVDGCWSVSATSRPEQAQQSPQLLDHVVRAAEQRWRHVEAERLGCFEINDQLDRGGLLHRKVRWLNARQNAGDIAGGLVVCAR